MWQAYRLERIQHSSFVFFTGTHVFKNTNDLKWKKFLHFCKIVVKIARLSKILYFLLFFQLSSQPVLGMWSNTGFLDLSMVFPLTEGLTSAYSHTLQIHVSANIDWIYHHLTYFFTGIFPSIPVWTQIFVWLENNEKKSINC